MRLHRSMFTHDDTYAAGLSALDTARAEGRAAGLEEAAQIVDPSRNGLVRQYILCVDAAAAIRALKEKNDDA
jgi:hypothetical protein